MRKRPLRVLGIVIVVLAAAATGCSGEKKSTSEKGAAAEPPATQTTVPVPPSVTVTARDYGFDVPPEIEGGVIRVTLQNDGKLKHEAVIVATGNTPLDRVKQDLTPVVKGEGKPTPDYLRFQGGVSLVPGGTSEMSFLTLPVGNYAVVCTLTDADSLNTEKLPDGAGPPSKEAQRFHYDLGMAVPFTVKKANTATMPPTDGTVVARDWAFEVPPLVPGFKVFTFRNDGQQDHSLAVAEFADGMDEAAARTAFETLLSADADHPAPDDTPVPEDVAFAGPLGAGAQSTFPMNFKVHRTYVFACYMSDRTGGPLHATGKHMVSYATTPNG
ncbi:MAG TPA: hypothetical protein VG034_29150 [Acidimicrobiia bacterium]|nr:hypothetical protein [Acidimicrobiia bacterium]